MAIYKKFKLPATREEWLENRSKGLGGSDAGAVIGVNKYKSPYTLWCEKTGKLQAPDIDNEAMRIGRDLEDYVAQRFTEATGKKVHKSGFSYQSIKHPFMLANIDRWVTGEDAGLECKTANAMSRVDWEGGNIPESYYTQCVHYMAVTGAKKWYIAVLVMGKAFYYWEVQRNEEEIQALIEMEEEFWNKVQNGTEPHIDGSDSTTETIKTIYGPIANETLEIDIDPMENELEILANIEDQIKELEKTKTECQNKVKRYMEDAVYGHCHGYKVTYKETKPRVSVDSKKLQKEYPGVYEDCIKVGQPTRPFKLERIKEEEF